MDSMDSLDEMTLSYLMNREQYERYCNKSEKIFLPSKKNKKFYKRRIWDVCKRFLEEDTSMNMVSTRVQESFDRFVQQCVIAFQEQDKSDILQSEYQNDNVKNDPEKETEKEKKESGNVDSLLMYSPKKINTLDTFVKKKKMAKKKITYPLQKQINVKDPIFKTKGVKNMGKKKSIDGMYEDKIHDKDEI